MKWSLVQLQRYQNEPLIFTETIDLKEQLMKREKELLDVSPITVEGTVLVESQQIIVDLFVTVDLTLPSARSLDPVVYPMGIRVNEVYVPKNSKRSETIEDEDNSIIYLEKDVIDLYEAVEDGILLHIPLQVFAEGEEELEMPSGNDWEVISQSDYEARMKEKQESKIDPRLAGLADLLSSEEED
ncbi:YceD family protein [Isobaculum melis]|uniref:DUF177 domain-containing protein n=1 Tax=Isobaculum melis TaxID=142588 RepID=A0A1H9T7I4_9LACT|nr:YceD family protein [Isobaculum melis]SER93096.1 uncharacterized protein SAMN04488559_11129 [Isobaculum melis]